jgi:molybdopterin/thiamine biosynthesis adenylyltransferase
MSRPARWWQTGECSIANEQQLFETAGLDFKLDDSLLERAEVVVFRGQLRFGDRRCAARVVYPPGYASGHQSAVFAPGLQIPRHKRSDGLLCLDHPSLGRSAPMSGAEAIERAELLWRLSAEDPDALRELEVDAPEPAIETYMFEWSSAVFLFGLDVDGHDEGWIRISATSSDPFRGGLAGVGAEAPVEVEFTVDAANAPFRGPAAVCGFWRRVAAAPPGPTLNELGPWMRQHHGDLVQRGHRFARVHRQITRMNVPALVSFVFPDEGPRRGEYHDQWLIVLIDADGTPSLPRPVLVHEGDQWIRQPQLTSLGAKKVGVVGTGALGSQIAALLARAGVGDFFLVDPDVVSPGILVRHHLDFEAVGLAKVEAVARHLLKINPHAWAQVSTRRYGSASGGTDAEQMQREDDEITSGLADCDVIINATAHSDTGFHLSRVGDALKRPVLHVAVSSGAWSGRALVQRHGRSGCLECMALHQDRPVEDSPTVPEWSEDPALPEVLDHGCAQPTFTGPGFEIAEVAASATRTAIAELLDGDGYPTPDYDLVTMRLREPAVAHTIATYSPLPRHPDCTSCAA